jgi:ribosomal protein S18 acetylase RimI-like enzyme
VEIRRADERDIPRLTARIVEGFRDDAAAIPSINAVVDVAELEHTLAERVSEIWLAENKGRILGHLTGAILGGGDDRAVWLGPDSHSYDDAHVLEQLLAHAKLPWVSAGVTTLYAWVPAVPTRCYPWIHQGARPVHHRGVYALREPDFSTLPTSYEIRRSVGDVAVAATLDRQLDQAQGLEPDAAASVAAMTDLLEDPEVHHYLAFVDEEPVGQCFSYPLDERRGSFPHVVHVAGLVVAEAHRHRGLGRALVSAALTNAYFSSFTHAEVHWREDNPRAQRFWTAYGFAPTFVRVTLAL